ncbi:MULTISPECIES: hypothetical protein [unclassified Gilliamella]|uniref:RCC1 domain-containing protein n=1 Tax=unclassified Gilliamella TaxID=2685620 RepID=UPI00130C0927|nr:MULTISPECIES: hypothetical protein [unclassified Gilliamella]MWP48321.1 hypothetical protein [Gilliamella sp. Lep-s35]MWP68241.1 hypothetical protein [Gilliamella sp. Lep-s5]MWP76461.1 hypothetical protein [Gilliamella sp. Lep-s21]
MKLIKLVVLFVSCLCCCSLFANERSDAVLFSIKSGLQIPTASNSAYTGITIENGDLWIWGYRDLGLQGNGVYTVSSSAPPARVKSFVEKGLSITQVATGIAHIIALDDQGNVWGWGQNGYQEAAGGKYKGYPTSPVLVLENKDVIMINAGEYTSYALTRSGEVYSWGYNLYGQAGQGTKRSIVGVNRIAQKYFNNRPVVLIGAAYESGYAINDNGEVFAWGDEESNAFGFENISAHVFDFQPKQITNLPVDGKNIAQITGGNRFTTFVTSSADVYSMGAANHIGIGCDSHNDARCERGIKDPQLITGNVGMLYCRYAGCIATTKSNKISVWGVTAGAFNHIIYEATPTIKSHIGNLTKVDGGKESLLYWNDEGKVFGVGFPGTNKFRSGTGPVDWPGVELKFVTDEMKKVYGEDYIPGQGF